MYSNFRKMPLLGIGFAASVLIGSIPVAGGPNHPVAMPAAGAAEMSTPSPLAAAAVESKTNDPLRIVAVGDSITLGYEPGLAEKSKIYGYADRVYEQALYHGPAELQNFGILGLKSAGLLHWLEAAEQGKTVTAEEVQEGLAEYPFAADTIIAGSSGLHDALSQADLIVMTIGGNDFLPIFSEIRSRTVPPEELSGLLADLQKKYIQSLEASLRVIHTFNPRVKIVLADQYLPVPRPSQVVTAVTEEQYAVLTQEVSAIRSELKELADKLKTEGFDINVANVSEPFAGNEFVYTSIREGDSHPNSEGYGVIGEAFSEAIWGEYREAGKLSAGVPLHIIVNGKEVAGGSKPVVKNGTTFLPMRDIANALGATLAWNGRTQSATIHAGGKEAAFTIGAKTMKVNGQTVPLQTPAYLEKTGQTTYSTYLPLAALSKGLGYQVVYRQRIQTVFINGR